MKVVITGATGIIGRTLIEYLLENDISVLAIIRENTNKQLPEHKNLKVIKCDLQNLCNLVINEKYDVFYHLAWARYYWRKKK